VTTPDNRPLSRSLIQRDGLKAGTPAPDFTLPRLDRSGDISLTELRGKPVLLAKVKEMDLTFPIALQKQWEISKPYAMFATPLAYLIDKEGVIQHDIAVGPARIIELMGNGAKVGAQLATAAV
jgi:hypothetical protein